jgi:hypothetical protein
MSCLDPNSMNWKNLFDFLPTGSSTVQVLAPISPYAMILRGGNRKKYSNDDNMNAEFHYYHYTQANRTAKTCVISLLALNNNSVASPPTAIPFVL